MAKRLAFRHSAGKVIEGNLGNINTYECYLSALNLRVDGIDALCMA